MISRNTVKQSKITCHLAPGKVKVVKLFHVCTVASLIQEEDSNACDKLVYKTLLSNVMSVTLLIIAEAPL